jgi:hypothetical protein
MAIRLYASVRPRLQHGLQRPVGQMPWTRGPKHPASLCQERHAEVVLGCPARFKVALTAYCFGNPTRPLLQAGQISLHSAKFSNARILNSTRAIVPTVKLFPGIVSDSKWDDTNRNYLFRAPDSARNDHRNACTLVGHAWSAFDSLAARGRPRRATPHRCSDKLRAAFNPFLRIHAA